MSVLTVTVQLYFGPRARNHHLYVGGNELKILMLHRCEKHNSDSEHTPGALSPTSRLSAVSAVMGL